MKLAYKAVVTAVVACLFTALGVPSAIAAERFDSVYTKIDLEQCAYTPPDSIEGTAGGTWVCDGYKGTPVHVAEGDARMFVSFGANAVDEPAAHQTLPDFNTIGETLEWRLIDRGANQGGWQPFATILRWHPQPYDDASGQHITGQVLIVTRLGFAFKHGGTCHIAYVDAQKTPDANLSARDIADTRAADFDCERDEIIRVGMPE